LKDTRYYKFIEKFGIPETIQNNVDLIFNKTEASIMVMIVDAEGDSDEIAKSLNIDISETETILNSLYYRGYVSRIKKGERHFYKAEDYKTIFYQFIDREFDKLTDTQRKPFQKEFMDRYLLLFEKSLHPVMKVIPIEEPLDEFVPHLMIPYTKASEILAQAKKMVVIDCICRKTMRRFDKPLNVCLVLGEATDFYVERGIGKVLTQKEAQDVLKLASDNDLVHTMDNPAMRYPTHIICNCDDQACVYIRGLKEFGSDKAITKSGYIAVTDFRLCTNCGTCVDKCIFGAKIMENGTLQFIKEKCYGCGLCVKNCPDEAVKLEIL
jgi:ferredoxin/predicted transcriptional regulator